MNLVSKIIKWIYEIEVPEYSQDNDLILDFKRPELTKYNPATGLPMIGGLDVGGNLIGTSNHSDYSHHRNSMDDHYRYYSR